MDVAHFDPAAFAQSACRASGLMRVLANEKRLLVLCRLADGEMSVGALQAGVALSQSALSQHLALLREQGIVATRRERQTIFYRIVDPATLRVMQTLAELFCPPALENRS